MRIAVKITSAILCAVIIAALSACSYVDTPNATAANTPLAISTAQSAQTASAAEHTAEETVQISEASPEAERIFTQEEIIDKIIELVATQETAIRTADPDLMAQTINPIDTWLTLESRHLAADQKVAPVHDYTRTVSDISYAGYYYLGTVKQSFTYEGKQRESSEPRYFMFQDGEAYDMGTALEKASSSQVFVSYLDGEYELAMDLADTVNEYVTKVNEMWAMDFRDIISIKVYASKDVFLYSAKLSMPDWVGGWYERGESIKTYLYDTTIERYQYLMRHESTHMMLAAATNDNAAYWLQEGFATTMPEYVSTGRLSINREATVREAIATDRLPTVAEHTAANLESMSDDFDVQLYYGYSSAMVVYLLERTDDATLIKLFDELRTHPYISLTLSEKALDAEAMTEKCIKKATGRTMEAFYAGFDEWLRAKLS